MDGCYYILIRKKKGEAGVGGEREEMKEKTKETGVVHMSASRQWFSSYFGGFGIWPNPIFSALANI